METGLAGKVVLITGATRNHGRASALAFAREGAHLLLCTRRSMDLLEETAALAAKSDVRVVTDRCDVTDEGQVQAFVHKGLTEFGHLEVVVNNVLFPVPRQALDEIPFELWKRKIEVETTGSFLLCKQVLPTMIAQEWGRIIHYTGLDAFKGSDILAGSTELGIVGLTRGIAREYGKYHITANCLGSGGIETEEAEGGHAFPPGDRDPIPRWGRPEEIAFLTVALCSEDAGYVTGQCLLANGGKYFL